MSASRVLLCVGLLLVATTAAAHRLDEYLQATTIAVEKDSMELEIRLTPGILVFPTVFADIDRDADGAASEAEQRAYAERVLGDLALSVDGRRVSLRLVSWRFAPVKLLQEGLGEIQLQIEADAPGTAPRRRLTFHNRHHAGIASYLVNGLVPRDADIRLGAPQRNYDQSFYEVDYADASTSARALSFGARSGLWSWVDAALAALIITVALLLRRYRSRVLQ